MEENLPRSFLDRFARSGKRRATPAVPPLDLSSEVKAMAVLAGIDPNRLIAALADPTHFRDHLTSAEGRRLAAAIRRIHAVVAAVGDAATRSKPPSQKESIRARR